MEVLRMTSPPGSRSCHTHNAPDSPPSSPRHAFTMEEVDEAPLGEVRAAIPFLWELTPGTPKADFEMHVEEEDDDEDDDCSSDEAPVTSPAPVSQLRLPPRLQHLSSCSSDATASSKVTMLCGFMRSTLEEEEVTILGMQSERRHHRIRSSLSPLRFLSSSETSLSRDSVSSSFSSPTSLRNSSPDASLSSSTSSSPQAPDGKGRSLNDLVPDTPVVAPKESATRKLVESRSELLQKQRFDDGDKMENRPPPPATSTPSSLPSRPFRREHLGRALFANRLGLLCSCLGELPQSH